LFKWIGGVLGAALGGPLAALVGFAIGAYIDIMALDVKEKPVYEQEPARRVQKPPGNFAMSLLVLISAVMKADGKVMRSELDMVKSLLLRSYPEDQVRQYLIILRELVKQKTDVTGVCRQIRANMVYSQRHELLHILFKISRADGEVSSPELNLLEYISTHLGITTPDFMSLKAQFVSTPDSDYKVLEISPQASDDEVKKAYRRMAMKFHPDKLNSLSESERKASEEKFRRVKHAYESISRKRGLR
jgi:DnaJ like chaperone protein